MVSDLYTIKATDKSMTLKELMSEHERGLSMAIVERVSYAVENKIRKIDIAQILTGSVVITLHSKHRDYRSTLETNMETLIKYEEYELCAAGKKALDILDKKSV